MTLRSPRLFDVGIALASVVFAASLETQALAQPLPAPTVRPAIDGILAAFDTHPLVGLGDKHGLAQETDFYMALIRAPRFARDVGNVVVEFGGAAHQDVVDRYVAGEAVPYAELRKAWTDVVGWVPTVTGQGYLNFFAAVRASNLTLPADQRVRVWLGEPAIDWPRINTRADLASFGAQRDEHAAQVIRRNILAKNKKALVIYGGGHFGVPSADQFAWYARVRQSVKAAGGPDLPANHPDTAHLEYLIEKESPGAFYIVSPYTGFTQETCSKDFEKTLMGWPNPALATSVRGSTMENELRRAGCDFGSSFSAPPGVSKADYERGLAMIEDRASGITSDAILFLGPAATLTKQPVSSDLYLDAEYRAEIDRRNQIMGQPTLSAREGEWRQTSPRPFRDYPPK